MCSERSPGNLGGCACAGAAQHWVERRKGGFCEELQEVDVCWSRVG